MPTSAKREKLQITGIPVTLGDGEVYRIKRESPLALDDGDMRDKLMAVEDVLDGGEAEVVDTQLRRDARQIDRCAVLIERYEEEIKGLQGRREEALDAEPPKSAKVIEAFDKKLATWYGQLDDAFVAQEKAEDMQIKRVERATQIRRDARVTTMEVARWAIARQNNMDESVADNLLDQETSVTVCGALFGINLGAVSANGKGEPKKESPLSSEPDDDDSG